MFNPFKWNRPTVEEVTPNEVSNLLSQKKDILVLDVRTRQEYSGDLGHIKGSVLLPLQSLWHNQDDLVPYKEKEILVCCRSGQRSAEACRILGESGFKVKNMRGGMILWNQSGLPVER